MTAHNQCRQNTKSHSLVGLTDILHSLENSHKDSNADFFDWRIALNDLMHYATLPSAAQADVNDAGGHVQLGCDPAFLLIETPVVIVSKVGLAERRCQCSVKHFQIRIFCCALALHT